MPSIRLTDADRARLGGPELLPFNASSFTNREAIELQKLGYPTPSAFLKALKVEVVDGDSRMDYEAWTTLVWLLLKRAGVETDLTTLTYDVSGLAWAMDEPVEPKAAEAPGKASGHAASTSSRRKSSTPTATSKPRSSRASSTS